MNLNRRSMMLGAGGLEALEGDGRWDGAGRRCCRGHVRLGRRFGGGRINPRAFG